MVYNFKCVNNCKDTWFGYMAKAEIEIEVDEKGETLDKQIYDY